MIARRRLDRIRARSGLACLGGLLWLLAAQGAGATPEILHEAQRRAIVAVIEKQLAAFQRDDAPAAFAVAALSIQQRFGTPDAFISMVRTHYAPVYRPRSVRFLELDTRGGAPLQRVDLIGPDGLHWQAAYLMTRDGEGRWRIEGCALIRLPGDSA